MIAEFTLCVLALYGAGHMLDQIFKWCGVYDEN